jgi:hypothetical protein
LRLKRSRLRRPHAPLSLGWARADLSARAQSQDPRSVAGPRAMESARQFSIRHANTRSDSLECLLGTRRPDRLSDIPSSPCQTTLASRDRLP